MTKSILRADAKRDPQAHGQGEGQSRSTTSSRLKQPTDIEEFLLFRLFRLCALAMRGTDENYQRELGISRREWRILTFLRKMPGASLKELSSAAALNGVVASRCISAMAERGLVRKERLADNKRIMAIRMTERGEALEERARAIGSCFNARLASCLSDDDATRLDAILLDLERHVSDLRRIERIESGDGESPLS